MKPKGTGDAQGKQSDASLDSRYGKIGIPALAAALTVKKEDRKASARAQDRSARRTREPELT